MSAQLSSKTSVQVGLIAKALPCAPLWVAQRADIFARKGLDVTFKLLGSGDAVTDAIRSGEVRFGLTTPEGAINDQAGGGNQRILGALTNQLPFKLIGLAPHTTISALRGGRIGVSSMTEGTVHVLRAMLASHGLKYPDDYRMDVVGTHIDRWELLQAGQIDAGLQITPYDHIAIEAGYSDLGSPADYIPEFAFVVISADSVWCSENEKITTDFVDGLREGAAIIYDDRPTAVQMVSEETGVDPRLIGQSLNDLTGLQMMPRDLKVTRSALAAVVDTMREEVTGALGDFEQVVDHSYLDA
jgi:ABC-type nitrate/sulfonate/bicarbonate transport system substrate-binding protein